VLGLGGAVYAETRRKKKAEVKAPAKKADVKPSVKK